MIGAAVVGGLFAVVCFIYITNIGQLVHRTDDPRRLERIGRK